MNKRSINNKLGIVLALIVCVAVGISVYFWQENRISSLHDENERLKENIKALENLPEATEDQKSNSSETNQKQVIDDFKKENHNYYGKLVINGYATQQEIPEFFCEENCSIFTYVFFNVLNTENEFLDDYLREEIGNSFVGENSIGLGCIEENVLWRWNDSDKFGMKKNTNSLETSKAILNSSKEKPIRVELEQYLYTGGTEAPDCYSHFAQVKVVE